MGRSGKVGQRRKKNAMPPKNLAKKEQRKLKKLKKPRFQNSAALTEHWDEQKSLRANLQSAGLAFDPNERRAAAVGGSAAPVAEALSVEAAAANANRFRGGFMTEPDVLFAVRMMETHGEDYKAMARDEYNYYQETPKQIRNKIQKFKNDPTKYRAYLIARGDLTV